MGTTIKELTDSKKYFNILSEEWKELITPVWQQHASSSNIYGLFLNNELIGGGILFSKMPPFATQFEKDNATLFEKGYLYLGYVWVRENHRNKGYASNFLTLLKNEHPNQKYWLTIEEENLRYFYEQNGFTVYAESENEYPKEWILTYNG
ncbi:acetyltransferase (GNAT) family protein [Tenacibaculum adriaticum]|uniref:Acetyltransferase (GNAT) family protein n=1 Tax=Tenacibaculum adriaticum TaxID=413713 RepID=A0A5S5DS27_9FLAO|nr:GNAT family N-acetyltransferase [Tenacibaculum adriaticum]TYP98723.1 acetyltransferase (GNAT) family protein [Tenacibaculum adriaticum]